MCILQLRIRRFKQVFTITIVNFLEKMSNDIEDVPYGKGRTFDPKLNMFAKDLIKEFEHSNNLNVMHTFRQLAKK